MKPFGDAFTLSCALLVCLRASWVAAADDDQLVLATAQRHVRAYTAEITKAGAEVTKALPVAMEGKFGEVQKWEALDEKSSRFKQIYLNNLGPITSQVEKMIRITPSVTIPSVSVANPFAGPLGKARARHAEVEKQMKNSRLNKMACAAKVRELQEAIKGSQGTFLGDFLESWCPSVEQLVAVPIVVAAGAVFAAPIVVGAAATATVLGTQIATLRESAKGMKGEHKAYGELMAIAREAGQRHARNEQALRGKVDELARIVGILEKHDKAYREITQKASDFASRWRSYSERAMQDKRQEDDRKFHEGLSKPPKVPVKVYTSYGKYSGYVGTVKPIEYSEYQGEVRSLLSSLRSLASSVCDGSAAPAEFGKARSRLSKQLTSDGTKASANVKRTEESLVRQLTSLGKSYQATTSAIYKQWPKRCHACEARDPQLRASNAAKAAALQQALRRAAKTYQQQLRAASAPLGQAMRERARIWARNSRVQRGAYGLQGMIASQGRQRKGQYDLLRRSWGEEMRVAHTEYGRFSTLMPRADHVRGMDEWSRGLERSIANSWRYSTPAEVKQRLEQTIVDLLEIQRLARDTYPELLRAHTDLAQVRAKAQAELSRFLNDYGQLVGYGERRWTGGDPAAWQKRQERWVAGTSHPVPFPFKKEDYAGIDAIIDRIEAAIGQVDELVEWVGFFKKRVGLWSWRFDRACIDLTGMGLRDLRETDARELVARELKTGVWGALSRKVDTGLPNKLKQGADGSPIPDWQTLGPIAKLRHARQRFSALFNDTMRRYTTARRHGGVVLVSEAAFRQRQQEWKTLAGLISAGDAAAKAHHGKAEKIGQQAQAGVEAIRAAYGKMPGHLQRLVVGDRDKTLEQGGVLRRHVQARLDALRPVGQPGRDGPDSYITSLMAEYKQRMEAALAQRRLWEAEQKRRREEEERRRLEQEAKRRQAEEAHRRQAAVEAGERRAVTALYDAFREAYENENVSGLLSLLGPGWGAGDGATVDDVEETFRNMFDVFDTISFKVTGLGVKRLGPGKYEVSYTTRIDAQILDNDIEHTETSRVTDEVHVRNGKAVIARTVAGRYWTEQ